MYIIRLIWNLPFMVIASLVGNYVGDQLYYLQRGERAHQFQWIHTNEQGEKVITLNPLMSNFIPGLMMGFLRRPHWFWAFIGGAAASVFLGDRYEHDFNEFINNIRANLKE